MTIWTIGHSTRTLQELVGLLREHQIDFLADVRAFPTSARCPHFQKENLARRLPETGIQYGWFGKELGGYRKKGNPNSPHAALVSRSFRNYADHTESEEFRRSAAELGKLAGKHRVAILCAEKLWWRCHRSLLSDYLAARLSVEMVHIVAEGQSEPHRLHRAARLLEGRLVYDVDQRPRLF